MLELGNWIAFSCMNITVLQVYIDGAIEVTFCSKSRSTYYKYVPSTFYYNGSKNKYFGQKIYNFIAMAKDL